MENKNKEKNSTYWKDLKEATKTTTKGLGLTWQHFQNSIKSLAQNHSSQSQNANAASKQPFDEKSTAHLGIVTNMYPHEAMPIPDNGRYKLHNEMDDCIVCNKCAEACPVNCIDIEPIRSSEQVGRASDGSPIRFYAAKFDIDMAKCCFCGLCTVVCPTECLTMTKEFDFSSLELSEMNYEFGNLSKEEADQKKKEWEEFQAKKAKNKSSLKPIQKKPEQKKSLATDQKPAPKVKISIKKPTIKIKKVEKEEQKTTPKIKVSLAKKTADTEEKKPVPKVKVSFKKPTVKIKKVEKEEQKTTPKIKVSLAKKTADTEEKKETQAKKIIKIKRPPKKE